MSHPHACTLDEIEPDLGHHNAQLPGESARLLKGGGFQNCATVQVTLTRGVIPIEVVTSWLGLQPMMNQKFGRIFAQGMACADGYERVFETLARESHSWQYILTLEEDVIVPSDAWLRLVAGMTAHPEYAGIGALCWTKRPGGQPMILGSPDTDEYYPQPPRLDGELQECNAIHLGCTLWRAALWRDRRFTRPWFAEDRSLPGVPGKGITTGDVFFCHQARKLGYRFAIDTGLHVGHRDPNTGRVW